MTERLCFECRQQRNIFLFSKASSQPPVPIQRHNHCVPWIISTQVKWQGGETHQSPPSNRFHYIRGHEGPEGGRGIAPLILNLGAKWQWVVKATPRPLCPFYRSQGGPQAPLPPGFDPRTLASLYTEYAIPVI